MIGKTIESTVIPDPVKVKEGRYEKEKITKEDRELSENLPVHSLEVLDGYVQGNNYFYLCRDLDTDKLHQVHPTWIISVSDS